MMPVGAKRRDFVPRQLDITLTKSETLQSELDKHNVF